jgi:hypothetical protein
MHENVGGIDRIGRLIIGGVALVVGVVLLVTGTTQKCPINEAAGIDTTE